MKIRNAEWAASVASPKGFPTEGTPEVALLGRSNVGKSSLLNRMVERKKLARTSSTPGKTRLIHFFHVDREPNSLLLADLPGYGYAKVSKKERASWQGLVESYLDQREPLRVALLLQDLRRDLKDDELDLLAWLEERGVATLLVLTKCDKFPPMRRKQRIQVLLGQSGLPKERLLPTSVTKNFGIPELWTAIDSHLNTSSQVG